MARPKNETVMATITRIHPRTHMINLRTADGRKLTMHKVMLVASGFDCIETLRVNDRVRCIVQTTVRVDHWVREVTGVAPGPRP